MRASNLYGCKLVNNCASNDGLNAYGSVLVDCEVSGTGVYSCKAERTVFSGIGAEVVMDANLYVDTPFTNKTLWKGSMFATNCLFACNNLNHLYQFAGETANGLFINCTVVSNTYDNLFNNCKTIYPMAVENSVFVGNRKVGGSSADISVPGLSSSTACQAGSISFKNCAYGKLSASGGLDVYLEEGAVMYQFGKNGFPDDPKFQHHRDAKHPFALRRTSPLIGKGRHEPWMDTATDLRGEGFARANGESVDIGCYQCWLKPAGTVFSIR